MSDLVSDETDDNEDPNALVWGFAQLVMDALAQPASTDLAAYVDHAVDRLGHLRA
jgi:hypothetical protein